MKTKLAFLMSLALLVLALANSAPAGELVGARPVLAINATPDTLVIQTAPVVSGNGVTANDLPDAYLFWSEDGATFDIGRYFNGTLETMFPIPANSSLTIPAPTPIKITHGATVRWEHHIFINSSTVTDSVFIIPLDR